MRTMVSPYCAPDSKGMAHALAQHYGLPMFGLGGAASPSWWTSRRQPRRR